MPQVSLIRVIVALAILAATASCDEGTQSSLTRSLTGDCRRYEPAGAKVTFDGRVGGLVFRNASGRAVDLLLYHPDSDGSIEVGWSVPGNTSADLGNGFGNDWGIRAATSCVTTVGRAGRWSDGRFLIEWRGDSLIAGDSTVIGAGKAVPAESLRPAVALTLPTRSLN